MQGQGSGNANDERDTRTSSRRRERLIAVIGATTAAAAYLDNDTVPRHVHISSLRGIDKDCVGAIDGTHIPCTPIGVSNPTTYRNRKGVNFQNILAACSFDMKFMYLLFGWEGLVHDARVLTDVLSNPREILSC